MSDVTSVAGKILVNTVNGVEWCYPCPNNCENGKVIINQCGYAICSKCNGNSYVRSLDE